MICIIPFVLFGHLPHSEGKWAACLGPVTRQCVWDFAQVSVCWDLSHFWTFQPRKSSNRGRKRGKTKWWKSKTGGEQNVWGIVSLRLILIIIIGCLFSFCPPSVWETLETWALNPRGFPPSLLIVHHSTASAWKADGEGCESVLSPQIIDILMGA